jgi:diguanylate cyclase (GGDEF)-like protein/PAS domain S-box-containing protein
MSPVSTALAVALIAVLLAAGGLVLWVAVTPRPGRIAPAAALRASLDRARLGAARHQALYRIVVQDWGCVVAECDSTGRLLHLSPDAEAQLGLDPAQLLTHQRSDVVHPDDLEALTHTLTACGPDQPAGQALCRVQQTDGRMMWLDVRCRHVPENAETVVLLRDVSETRLQQDHLADALNRLERLALRDQLTGLFNRAGFLSAVDRMLASQQFLAVLFIDLDRFKTLNDAHGHAIGDIVLRETGNRLTQILGQDATLARLSGDEFAVLLPADGTDVEIAAHARDVLRVLSEPVRTASMTLEIGATVGIAVSPRDGRTASALLRAADIALAYGKTGGCGTYRFFEARMGAALDAQTQLKHELRAAISKAEIVPFFQPLVRVADNTLAGFEVLARWVHPHKGTLTPDIFLPLVDEMGLGTEMFTAQLAQVCAIAQDWPQSVRLSLNLSPHELKNDSLPELVGDILAQAGFSGSRLEVEITEDALIHDSKTARRVLDGLRALGMTVSLDDFGTGYSSLYHLRELPFDKVKIDKSFMRALDTDAESARYVAAIIGLCHALGLDMTAEGIEDASTLAQLRELGCVYGQGYLFGRPAPAAEACRLVMSNSWGALAAE